MTAACAAQYELAGSAAPLAGSPPAGAVPLDAGMPGITAASGFTTSVAPSPAMVISQTPTALGRHDGTNRTRKPREKFSREDLSISMARACVPPVSGLTASLEYTSEETRNERGRRGVRSPRADN